MVCATGTIGEKEPRSKKQDPNKKRGNKQKNAQKAALHLNYFQLIGTFLFFLICPIRSLCLDLGYCILDLVFCTLLLFDRSNRSPSAFIILRLYNTKPRCVPFCTFKIHGNTNTHFDIQMCFTRNLETIPGPCSRSY